MDYCFKNYFNIIALFFLYCYSTERIQKMYRNSTEYPKMTGIKL